MPPVNSAISNGGISGNDLGMNGFNIGGPSTGALSNTNSNSGGVQMSSVQQQKRKMNLGGRGG